MVRVFQTTVAVLVWLISGWVAAQCMMVPIPLDQRIDQSEYIVMGRLTGQESYWDQARTNIYTVNRIEVTAYLKNYGPSEIAVITLGGFVGLDGQVSYPSLKLESINEYVFFLSEAPAAKRAQGLQKREPGLLQLEPFADGQSALTKQAGLYFDLLSEKPQTEGSLAGRIFQKTKQAARTPDGALFLAREGVTGPVKKRSLPITSITPSTTNVGTIDSDDFITIAGSGFGAESNVFYANADDGGATLTATGVASDNVSWVDTQVVNKPSNRAGSGTVSVNGQTGAITVNYAHIAINSDAGFSEVTRQAYRLVDVDGNGGLTFIYNNSFNSNADATAAFERSLETWRCQTFANYGLDLENTSTVSTAVSDSVNIVTFDGSLPSGVLGRATSRFRGQSTGACQQHDVVWWVDEIDVQFAPTPAPGFDWNFGPDATTISEFDFETVSLHEVGHALGLAHRIAGGTLMHFASSNGSDVRTPNAAEIEGVSDRLTASSSLCFTPSGVSGTMQLLTAGTCALRPTNADLAVTKTVDDATPDEGDTITYTVTVTNNGSGDATNVSVTDQLPTGVTRTGTAANASQGSFNEGSGVWTVGSLANGNAATLGLEVTVDAGASSLSQPITNTTSNLTLSETDDNAGNDTGSVGITVSDNTDIAVSKSASQTTVNEGSIFTYTITAANNGPARATNVSLVDLLPTGISLTGTAPTASQGSFNTGSGLWTVGTVNNGANATLTLEVAADAGASSLTQPITNSTSSLSLDQTDTNSGNNSGSIGVTVNDNTDLAVTKSVDDGSVFEGQTITYTVTVTNNGPARATNVSLTDNLPGGVTRTATAPNASQGSFNDGNGIWTIGTLNASAAATLTLEATVDSGAAGLSQPITNTAGSLSLDQTDTNAGNNSASADITVSNDLDLAVTKTADDTTVDEGQTVTYTITVTNGGPISATNVSLTDNLPAGVTRTGTAANASQGSFNEGSGVWTVGTLAASANATLALEVTVDAGASALSQPITNTTSGLTVDQNDSNSGNDAGSIGITVSDNLDMAVTKTVTDTTPNEGDTVTYTITATNNGPARATNVALTDTLPIGVTRTGTAAAASQGGFNEGSGVWTVGTLNSGANATLQLEVTVDAGASALSQPITNSTSNLTVDQTDTNSSNNNGSVAMSVSDALDLAVTKGVSDSTPSEGDTITYTITATNNGPARATNVALTDSLPNGVTRTGTAAAASQGGFNEGSGVWTIGTLENGANATLALEVTVDAGAAALSQPITNTTSNLVLDQSDGNNTNNAGSVGITVSDALDLAVTKTVSNAAPDEGATLTYTITVTNNGPTQATNVALTDNLPNGVTRTSTPANASVGSFNDGTGVWTVGTLNNGVGATLTLEVTVDTGASSLTQPITNSTTNLTADQTDTNSSNDTGSVAINVSDNTDLSVEKTVSNNLPQEGETLTYTITARNLGPARATNVSLVDQLPDGVTRTGTAANASQGSFDEGGGLWSLGTLEPDGQATLQLEVTVDNGASALSQPITNTTTSLSLDQTDTNGANNSGSAAINLGDNTDIAVAKTVSAGQAEEGDSLTFTVTVTNNGPLQATNVAVNDTLPAGLTMGAVNASQGSFNSGTWSVGTLTNGASATLTMAATVDLGASSLSQPITNTADGLVLDQIDAVTANNSASASVTVSDNLDLAVSKTASVADPCPGEVFTYTISVTRTGAARATNVSLIDVLPSGVTRTATPAAASQGSFTEGSGTWAIGTLDPGASATLTLEVEVDANATGTVTNTTSNLSVDQSDTNAVNNSDSAVVTVTQPVQITAQPQSTNACRGQLVSFSVTATGGALSYQWFFDSGAVQGATGATYAFNVQGDQDAGAYHCEVTNVCGTVVSESAQLTVDGGSLAVRVSPSSAAQGLDPVSLEAVIECALPEVGLLWTNLTTNQTFTANPLVLQNLTQTTTFNLTVTDGLRRDVVSVNVIILVAEQSDFFDYNNDGCNNIQDLWDLGVDWNVGDFVGDPNGDGRINVLDLLYINRDDPLKCSP